MGPEGKENTFLLGFYLKIDKKIKFETTVWYLTGAFGVYITMQNLTLGRRITCWMLCKLVSPIDDNWEANTFARVKYKIRWDSSHSVTLCQLKDQSKPPVRLPLTAADGKWTSIRKSVRERKWCSKQMDELVNMTEKKNIWPKFFLL